MTLVLSTEQERARTAVLSWYRNPNRVKPWFFLTGFAGSGKSSVVTAITDRIPGKVLYAAPTGKAALVMRQKGCVGAQTIHSLIYRPKGNGGDMKRIEALTAELTVCEDPIKLGQLTSELKKLKEGVKPIFQLNVDSPLREADLLVVDEISMVPDFVMQDLLSFDVPILVQGDLGQLPPVGAKNFFKDVQPDFSLTEIHRQARDNPIIYLATLARQGKELPLGRHGESLVTRNKEDVNAHNHEQILVGTHNVRNGTNNKLRREKGFTSQWPELGDKVMCKRNDHKVGLLNGDMFTVKSFESLTENLGQMRIVNDELETSVVCHKEYFIGKEPAPWDIPKAQCFWYGWAGTVHSAQGSQFDSVFLYDESRKFNEPAKWRYTGLSRAVSRVTVLIP